MRLLTLLLVPATLMCGASRFARLGEFQGEVEVQLTAADPWQPAERNLPLGESAWVRTAGGGRVEIELDDGGVWRLGPDSLGEISDYTRLSTGQSITLLSLDHGTAYYTGQPHGKDVTMLVMPGAQAALLQGSRLRQTAQPGWSQFAVFEGRVRFSSPTAELDIREGATVRVEPAHISKFYLYPEIAAEPLDRWSEDRDKLQAAPASAAYVTAKYGVGDLDSAGKWLPTDDLGLVWKPEVAPDWQPYQKGHWLYLDTLGYTWVSGDSWGWLPYHNGRWTRKENVGWVWQPAVNTTFHPGEVYWVRGENFAGWGPLAPGEQPSADTTPTGYTAGYTSYAAFQPNNRKIDGTGFAAPAAEQLKTAKFVPALPSPAFLVARLDATRPALQVGRTRVLPAVTNVTFGNSPPCDAGAGQMNSPPDPPAPAPTADPGATPPPDGVYPVPGAAAVSVVDVPVIVNPPAHPDWARPLPAKTTATQTPQTGQTGTSRSSGISSGGTGISNKPIGFNPNPVRPPVPKPHPMTPPVTTPGNAGPAVERKITAMGAGEQNLYGQVLKDIEPSTANFAKALEDLNTWSQNYPTSAAKNDRLYYYIHVYNATGRGDKVLSTAAPLVETGVRNSFRDEQQVLQILVAASASVANLPSPTPRQMATGQNAARELLEFLPDYFAPRRKPANVSENAWSIARGQLETVAKQALARASAKRAAAN